MSVSTPGRCETLSLRHAVLSTSNCGVACPRCPSFNLTIYWCDSLDVNQVSWGENPGLYVLTSTKPIVIVDAGPLAVLQQSQVSKSVNNLPLSQ